jgi:hypothetical protein
MADPPDQLRYSLRFLSGRNQGSEYVLDDPMDLIVGRSSDVDLILVEGMVSRRHARITLRNRELVIEDLGSANGTFVNGEKIKRRRIVEGDRVLIGTSILRVAHTHAPAGTKPPPPDISFDEDNTANRYQVAGDLSEVGVPELLELFATPDRAAIIELVGPEGTARIYLQTGRVVECQLDRLRNAPADKIIWRVMGMARGSFAVQAYEEPVNERLDLAVPELLVDSQFRLGELEVLRQRLPERGSRMVMARPMTAPLSELDEADLDLLQLAHNHGDVERVLDASQEGDLEIAKRLLGLLDAGYLRRG